jgi:Beta-propeller repeat
VGARVRFPGVYDGLVQHDGSGAQQWMRALETSATRGMPTGIGVERKGNVFVSGDRSVGGGRVLTISKMDPDGVTQWKHTMGKVLDKRRTSSTGVAIDGDGNVFVTDSTSDTFPGETSAGAGDMLAVKFTNGGMQQWLTQYGTSGVDSASGIVTDGSRSIFVAGTTRPAGDIGTHDSDLFLLKLDHAGNQNL